VRDYIKLNSSCEETISGLASTYATRFYPLDHVYKQSQ
jgi:hypothetical protein